MAAFAVLERGETLARRMVARFGPAVGAQQEPELLVVGPGVGKLDVPLTCGTVLLPGSEGRLLERVRAKSAVSYGLSGRDTITLSSRQGKQLWVAVQRELVRLDGTVLERQEFSVCGREGLDATQILALTGAMLLLGVGPEELAAQ